MTNKTPEQRSYVARVSWVSPEGRYAMTNVVGIGRVTFSFAPGENVWAEGDAPIKGAKVVLSNLVMMDGGWRALKARYYRPEDQASK